MMQINLHTFVAPMLTLASAIATLTLTGCSSWPEQGQGGDVQVDTSRQYYLDQIDDWIGVVPESKGALETQWQLHNVKLDTLILRGARECIPARVREVTLMSQRARRELDGNLLEDARNTLVIVHREVDELERRLIYIKRHTHCPENLATRSLTSESNHKQSSDFRYRYALYMLRHLLNSDNAFANDSDQLSPLYREHLRVASRYLKAYPPLILRLNGHTDANASYDYNQDLSLRRARHVRDELVATGIAEDRMIIRAFGEHLPRATNNTWAGRLKNRRVHIEVLEPKATLDQLYIELDQQFGFTQAAGAEQDAAETINREDIVKSERVNQWQFDVRDVEDTSKTQTQRYLNDDFSYSYHEAYEQRSRQQGE
ncbi:OmpA family protein [Bacterioplanoides sp.]|uniref:OmpA family protein n=1 Tax=Bacterioplanoides sp. TaxID=2066072 RepID=UPI003B0097F3